MRKKKAIFCLICIALTLILTVYNPLYGRTTEVTVFEISAKENPLVANKPIIIRASEFPISSSKLKTATVYDGSVGLPTQADDLDGDGIVDEIVFQLQTDLKEGTTKTFELHVKEEGINNDQPSNPHMRIARGLYNETYMDWLPIEQTISFKNETGHLALPVHEVGDVIWVETDWAILCLFISAAWRQSAWKHIVMKDGNWDAVSANFNPWIIDVQDYSRWMWSRFMYDSDYGWHTAGVEDPNKPWNLWERIPDEVKITKVGPVRAIIQTYSGIGYNGQFGLHDKLHAVRTYTIYSGFGGINQNLRLAGGDEITASENMIDLYGGPLEFNSKYIDLSFDFHTKPWTLFPYSNTYDRVYSPNTPYLAGNNYREQPNLIPADLIPSQLNLTKLTAPFVGLYSSTTNNGFVMNFGDYNYIKDKLTTIYWKGREICVGYSFEKYPLEGINRILIPFSGSSTGNDPEGYMDTLNTYWTAEYALPVTNGTKTTPAITAFEITMILIANALIVTFYKKHR